MNPVTSQPGVNHCFMLPSPPTPSRTDNVSLDYDIRCCLCATGCGFFFGGIGLGVGSLLEVAATGTLASAHLPCGLCFAFGFSCFWRQLDRQLLEKKHQLDHAYLQDLQKYNVQLNERIITLLTGSSLINSTGKAEDCQQQEIAADVTYISQEVNSGRKPEGLSENSACSEGCEKLPVISYDYEKNNWAI